jgi:uncharacterized membrane protein
MDAYLVALFLHLVVVGLAFSAIALIHFHLWRLRRTEQVAEARRSVAVIASSARLMPVIALLLFVTGGYMTQVRWTWRTPWVELGVIGLVALLVIGLGVLKPRLGRIIRALAQATDARLSPDLNGLLRDRVVWVGTHVQPMLVIAVMFVMVGKPGLVGGTAALLVAAAVGVLWGLADDRTREP